MEKHHQDGIKEIVFPDGTIKTIFPSGEEESIFADGTVQRIAVDGTKTIRYSSGQTDTFLPNGKKVKDKK